MKKIVKPNLKKPIINGSIDEWGYILNDNIDITMRFAEETIQDLSNKDSELARLDEEKISKTQLPTLVKNTVDNYVETETKPDLETHVNSVNKPELDRYVNSKKIELDSHEKLKERRLDTYTTGKEAQLDNHVETVNKLTLSKFTETKKPIIDGYVSSGKQNIDNHIVAKKKDLDLYTETKKSELTSHTSSMKIQLEEKTTTEKGVLDLYTNSKKGELASHTNTKIGELNLKTEQNKGLLDSYEKEKEQELNTFTNTTIKPDITRHTNSEKEKATVTITTHTDKEMERITGSLELSNKLDKGNYVGTAQDLKDEIEKKVNEKNGKLDGITKMVVEFPRHKLELINDDGSIIATLEKVSNGDLILRKNKVNNIFSSSGIDSSNFYIKGENIKGRVVFDGNSLTVSLKEAIEKGFVKFSVYYQYLKSDSFDEKKNVTFDIRNILSDVNNFVFQQWNNNNKYSLKYTPSTKLLELSEGDRFGCGIYRVVAFM